MASSPQMSSRALERRTSRATPSTPSAPATSWIGLILVCSQGTDKTTTMIGLKELITEATPPGSRYAATKSSGKEGRAVQHRQQGESAPTTRAAAVGFPSTRTMPVGSERMVAANMGRSGGRNSVVSR